LVCWGKLKPELPMVDGKNQSVPGEDFPLNQSNEYVVIS
jgi:hypothetical protein